MRRYSVVGKLPYVTSISGSAACTSATSAESVRCTRPMPCTRTTSPGTSLPIEMASTSGRPAHRSIAAAHGAPAVLEHPPGGGTVGVGLVAPVLVVEPDDDPQAEFLGEVEQVDRRQRVGAHGVEAHRRHLREVHLQLRPLGERLAVEPRHERPVGDALDPPRPPVEHQMLAVRPDPLHQRIACGSRRRVRSGARPADNDSRREPQFVPSGPIHPSTSWAPSGPTPSLARVHSASTKPTTFHAAWQQEGWAIRAIGRGAQPSGLMRGPPSWCCPRAGKRSSGQPLSVVSAGPQGPAAPS